MRKRGPTMQTVKRAAANLTAAEYAMLFELQKLFDRSASWILRHALNELYIQKRNKTND